MDRKKIFLDFSTKLSNKIFDSYLEDELYKVDDKLNHFNWCWDKTIQEFKENGINFNPVGEHYDTFLNYFSDVFYKSADKSDLLRDYILSFWDTLLTGGIHMDLSEIHSYKKFYNLMANNLK